MPPGATWGSTWCRGDRRSTAPAPSSKRHLAAGAKRVILCSPPADAAGHHASSSGVNEDQLRPEHRIVSNRLGHRHRGAGAQAARRRLRHRARRSSPPSTPSPTSSGWPTCRPTTRGGAGRRARTSSRRRPTRPSVLAEPSAASSAASSPAASMNVPVANGSVVDLVCWHSRPVTVEAVNEVVRTRGGRPRWKGVLDYETDADRLLRHPPRRGLGHATTASPPWCSGRTSRRPSTWFDNGWGYAHRVVDLLRRFEQLDGAGRRRPRNERQDRHQRLRPHRPQRLPHPRRPRRISRSWRSTTCSRTSSSPTS